MIVPPDAVAIEAELGTAALRMMEENMRAGMVPAAKCLNDGDHCLVLVCGFAHEHHARSGIFPP